MLDILIVMVVITVIVGGFYSLNKYNHKQKPVSTKAVAISKTTKTQSLIASSPRAPQNIISLSLENNKHIKFKLDTKDYEKIPLRQKGILTYQGTEFISFKIDSES